jgi:hypothetical protein
MDRGLNGRVLNWYWVQRLWVQTPVPPKQEKKWEGEDTKMMVQRWPGQKAWDIIWKYGSSGRVLDQQTQIPEIKSQFPLHAPPKIKYVAKWDTCP